MTKRDKQASEYAAESYEKTHAERGVSHMSGACPHVRGTVTQYCALNFTLTDEEREAIERAIETLDGWQQTGGYHSAIEDDAATLRKLLERLT